VDARFARPQARVEGVRIDSVQVGPASGVRAKLIVFLPPQYGDPAYAGTKFPVVQLLPGYPGQPQTWLGKLKVAQTLLAEVRAGRSKPFVLVLPAMNVAGLRDTECSDVVGGPKVETWLTDDVRRLVTRGYRVRTDAAGWGVMGYSTGGFCATKLAMRRPDLFRAGVSMSGYFTIAHDAKTGDLFGGNVALERQNSPSWLVENRPPPPVALLLTGTAQDGGTVAQMRRFAAAARPPLRVSQQVAPAGGHNTGVWAAQVPACLAWLSKELGPPTG
jgi:enterochelin esterase-like enzyme